MKEKYTINAASGVNLRKAFFLFILFAGLAYQADAQLKLGNNPNTINASALLELESTNQGLLLPRLSEQQMIAITTPAPGLIVYNTDSACAYVYSNQHWTNLCGINLADFMTFITTSPGMDSIIRIIAEHASDQPLVDSIFHAVLINAGNLTAASGLVTVTNGTKSTLRNVTVDVNKDTLINVVINSPVVHDSVITIIANNSNKPPLRDSIFSTVVAQGKNVTGVTPIFVNGGAGASLRPFSVSIDTNRIVPLGGTPGQVLTRDSFGVSVWTNTTSGAGDNWGTQVISHDGTLQGNGTAGSPLGVDTAGLAHLLPVSPISDTIISIVTTNGKNVTGVTPILISGGTGAALQPVSVSIDSNRIVPLGGTPGQVLTRDSFGVSFWTNTVGDNWGSQVIAHDGTLLGNGTAGSPLGVDTAGLAHLLPVSPISDTIISIVTTNGKNVTGVSPILISGGTGAALQPVSVSIDSNRIVPLGGLPGQVLTRDSFGFSVWTNTTSGTGDNWGSQVISHDGTLQGNGTAGSPLGVDTAGLAHLLPVSPISDTIISIVTTNAKDLLAGSSLVTVTNGTGSTLKNVTVDVNKDTLVNVVVNSPVVHDSVITIIANNSNNPPLRDSIFSTVVAQGRDLTSASPALIVTGGAGATLQNSNLSIDSSALIHLLIISHLRDSLMDFKGFNVAGTSSSNTFLSLTLGLGSSPDVVGAYQLQQLTDTSTFPQFNDFGVFNSGSPSKFTAPIDGYYSLTYSVSLVVNPSLLSAGGTFSWGIALIKTNGTPTVIQSTRNTQVVSASALGVVGVSTVGTNTVTALVKLNAGDTVSPGLGATSGLTLGILSSNSTIQHFSGYWVK